MNDYARRGRGRPRPDDTIDRDKEVYQLIKRSGPLSRAQVMSALGVNTNVAYLSLTRLARQGRVHKVRDGKYHKWATSDNQD